MTTVAPFVVHTADAPHGTVQRCMVCRFAVMDNTARLEGRAMIPDGQPDEVSWWPFGALIATDKTDGTHPSMTYVIDGALEDDERLCAGMN